MAKRYKEKQEKKDPENVLEDILNLSDYEKHKFLKILTQAAIISEYICGVEEPANDLDRQSLKLREDILNGGEEGMLRMAVFGSIVGDLAGNIDEMLKKRPEYKIISSE